HRPRRLSGLPRAAAARGRRAAAAARTGLAPPRLRRCRLRRTGAPSRHGHGVHRLGRAPQRRRPHRRLRLCAADALARARGQRLSGGRARGLGRACAHLGAGRDARRPAAARPTRGRGGAARRVRFLHQRSQGTQSRGRGRAAAPARRAPGVTQGRRHWIRAPACAYPAPRRCAVQPMPPWSPAMTSRRRFIASVSLAATGAALAPLAACSQDRPDPLPGRPREKPVGAIAGIAPLAGELVMRTIPASGESIPAIGVGTSGSYEVPLDSPGFDALREVARIFFAGGGRLLDTSPNYSNAEDVVGALLEQGGWRERCFLATKLAADSREALEAQWAASLRRLRTDHVELLQVHNLRNMAEAMPYARELKDAGK